MSFIINSYRFSASGDSDAEAYFLGAGITDQTEKDAWTAFVLGTKLDGDYSSIKAFYPLLGTTATQRKYNAIDTTQHEGIWSGGWTQTADGAVGDGSSSYFNPQFLPSTDFNDKDDFGIISCYNTNVVEQHIDGCGSGAGRLALIPRYTGDTFYAHAANAVLGTVTSVTDSRGVKQVQRTGGSTYSMIDKGVATNKTDASVSFPSELFTFGARKINLSFDKYSSKTWAGGALTDGLTDAAALRVEGHYETFLTAIGRKTW